MSHKLNNDWVKHWNHCAQLQDFWSTTAAALVELCDRFLEPVPGGSSTKRGWFINQHVNVSFFKKHPETKHENIWKDKSLALPPLKKASMVSNSSPLEQWRLFSEGWMMLGMTSFVATMLGGKGRDPQRCGFNDDNERYELRSPGRTILWPYSKIPGVRHV